MSASAATGFVSVEEYLSNPAYERAEWVDGRIVQLNVGTKSHGRVQSKVSKVFVDYFDAHPGGYVANELRCRLQTPAGARFRLPDVAVVLGDEEEEQGFLDRAPNLAVEIRSPDDSMTELFRKTAEYFANGAKMVWLALPEERSVLVCEPDRSPKSAGSGESLDGGKLLPDLSVEVDYLFT